MLATRIAISTDISTDKDADGIYSNFLALPRSSVDSQNPFQKKDCKDEFSSPIQSMNAAQKLRVLREVQTTQLPILKPPP